MNTVSKDVKDYLVAQSLGTYALKTSGWGIWVGSDPPESESTSTTITLRDIGGPKPGYCFNKARKPMRYDGIQVRVRGLAYDSAYAKMLAIAEAIDKRGAFSVGTVRYSDIQMVGEIIFLEYDEKGRAIWVSTWQAFRIDTSAYA